MKEFFRKSLVVLVLAACFCIHLATLLKSEHPAGLDGYYYALQAKSFAETGSFENPDIASGYFLCGIWAKICGDPILGCKIWASLATAFLAASVYLFSKAVFRGGPELPFLFMVLASALPSVTQMSLNYINNLTGNAFFFMFAFCIMMYGKSRRKIILIPAVILFLLAATTHLVSMFCCLTFTGIVLVEKLGAKKRAVLLAAMALFGISVFFRERERFQDFISFRHVLPVFSTAVRRSANIFVAAEMSLAMILAWVSGAALCIKEKKFNPRILILPVTAFPFFNLASLDLGYRILLSSSMLSLIFSAWAMERIFTKRLRRIRTTRTALLALSAVILASSIFFTPELYSPEKDPPYGYYRKVAEKIQLDDDSLLICHLALNHVYTYYNNLRMALNYVPDFDFDKEKLWRAVHGVDISLCGDFYSENRDIFPEEDLVREIDGNYFLIREDLWQAYISQEDEELASCFRNWFNPWTKRPAFIRRNFRYGKYKKILEKN